MRTLAAPAAVAAALAVAAPALADSRTITGELAYRERIALPPGTDILLELRDAAGALVAERREAAGERQVPLPFAIEAPPEPLSLRAGLFSGGAPLWISAPLPVAEGDADLALGTVALTRFLPMGFATTFRCGEVELEVGFVGEIARMRIGPVHHDLVPVEAASGAKFESPDDPGTFAWSRGNEMTVSLRGAQLPACQPTLAGTGPFRARGNEPFWSLQIGGGEVTFSGDMGATTITAPLPEPEIVDGARRYVVPDAGLTVTVADRLARDTMTGMPYPAEVTVATAEATLAGTGGDPRALIAGVEWRAEDVAGKGIPDNAEVTLRFLEGGRVAGRSGCNRYMGGFELSGEGLSFGQLAGTMMACPEALMRLERDYLDALGRVTRFDFDETGALVLLAGDEPVALLRHH